MGGEVLDKVDSRVNGLLLQLSRSDSLKALDQPIFRICVCDCLTFQRSYIFRNRFKWLVLTFVTAEFTLRDAVVQTFATVKVYNRTHFS